MRSLAAFPLETTREIHKMRRKTLSRMKRARRGYLYVAVLFTTLIVSTMGLVALSTAALRTRSTIDANDRLTAEALARSAIEDAILRVRGESNWRMVFANNVEYPPSGVALGGGSYTYKLLDEDGNLSDDDSDSVRIVGIGRSGRAVAAESVRLVATGAPLSCLQSSFHCQGDISMNLLVSFTTNQQVSSNSNISATAPFSSIQGDAQAVGSVSGPVSGVKTPGAAARRMPGSSVLDYYLDNGAWISITSLPLVSGAYTIENQLLSPQNNPYGTRNLEGVYVIDCQGQRIRIKNSRIVGTIVLLNPASNSLLEGSLRWDEAVGNYPALLATGDIEIRFGEDKLRESSIGLNLNPVGTPYQGDEDNDQNDSYDSEVNGLVYLSGRFDAAPDFQTSRFRGVCVCNSITAQSLCRFLYRPLFLDAPPPGFARGNPMAVSPGSRRRETL
jgi:type II secretory pathway pseudopilin PulG